MKDFPELPPPYFWHRERDEDIAILYNHDHPTPPPPKESMFFQQGKGTEVVARASRHGFATYFGLQSNCEWREEFDSQEEAVTALYGRFLIGEGT
jgi:hypothetical protein